MSADPHSPDQGHAPGTASVTGSVPRELDAAALSNWPLPTPPANADKDARGTVVVIAGSPEMPGAAILAATAAMRAGGGKLMIGTAASVAAVVAAAALEARVVAWPETPGGGPHADAAGTLAPLLENCNAVLIGPGMQDGEAVCALVHALRPALLRSGATVVLDANAMDGVCDGALHGIATIVTPHAGEMARLTGMEKAEVQADAGACAVRYAAQWQATVLLKGATTWLAEPNGTLRRHVGGSVGLATSGSGDTLAGMVCGLAARGAPPAQAAAWACVLHAQAGLRLADRMGPLGYLARELPGEVPALMQTLSQTLSER